MPGLQIGFGDGGSLEKVITTFEVFGEKCETVGYAIKNVLREYNAGIEEAFAAESSMTGGEWDQLSDWAVKDRKGSTNPILKREGNLYRAYTESMLEHYEEAGALTRIMFIEIQAYGENGGNYAPSMAYGMDPNPIANLRGTATPKPIPARPVLPDSVMLTAMLSDAVSGYIVNPSMIEADRSRGMTYNTRGGGHVISGSIWDSGVKSNNFKAYDRIAGSLYE